MKEKIETIAKKVYGADEVEYAPQAQLQLRRISKLGLDKVACMYCQNQKSFTDDPDIIGRPTGFNIHVRDIEIAAGAGFVVPITGDMMRMPGLPETPASEGIDIDNEGNISGLF